MIVLLNDCFISLNLHFFGTDYPTGCIFELLLPTTTSIYKRKKTHITSLLWELNVLKIGQNREIS